MHRRLATALTLAVLAAQPAAAQYKADRIAGNVGLEAGSQAPPGLYVGYLLWVYPTDTIVDDDGNELGSGAGGLTSVLNGAIFSWVTRYKIAGGNLGGTFVLPLIRNRIERNALDVDTGADLTDSIFTPFNLGWHRPGRDFQAAYSLYLPTGTYEAGGSNNSGLGMVGQELSFAATLTDERRRWNGAASFAYEWHTKKKDQDIRVGQVGTLEGGVGRTFYKKVDNPLPLMTTFGLAGYSQFKITGDSGDDIPLLLRGFKDRVFALGPEVKVFIPQARLTLVGRVLPEFGARVRTRGTTISFTAVYVAKSLGAP